VPAAAPAAPAAAVTPAGRAAPPAPVAAPPPRPEPSYVAAAKARKKIPWWAMPVVGLLPLWVLLYAWALKPTEKVVAGPLGEGKEIYSTCSSCHGATGGGGVGRPLSNGEVLLTFPKLEDQASLVYTGSAPYNGKVYGDPDRTGGPHRGGSFNGSNMPQQGEKYGGALTDAEIIAVVCHERYTISGADPLDPKWEQEFNDWCAPGAPKFDAVESGESTLDELGISTTPKT
jgi:mono/diheme cytochrome c family protein